jgi:hypothetical protein
MFESRMSVSAYNWMILLSIGLGIFLCLIINAMSFSDPVATIVFSIEFGAVVIVTLFLIQRRKEAVQRLEGHEDQSIQRIDEINSTFGQLTIELQDLNERIKDGITKSKRELDLLQTQVIEISNQEVELKKQIKILQEVKPEAARILAATFKEGEIKNYIYGFILYVAGVVTPFVINYIFFKNVCF